MINRKQIEKAIYNKTPEERMEWFKSLDDNDMIEASRLINEIAKESPLYRESKTFRKKIKQTEKKSNKFEDIVSKEIASNLMHEIKMDEHLKKLDEHHDKLVAILIEEIKKNPPNVNDLKKIAKGIRQIDKDHNLYDPSLWGDVDLD